MVNEISELDLIEIGPTLKGANPEAQLQAAKAWLTREEQAGELGTGKFSIHLAHSLDEKPEETPEKSFDPPIAEPDVPAQEPHEATAQAPDPLYKESMAFVRDDRTEGAVHHQPREEPKPKPPAVDDLRREHRDLMTELLR